MIYHCKECLTKIDLPKRKGSWAFHYWDRHPVNGSYNFLTLEGLSDCPIYYRGGPTTWYKAIE